MEQEFIEWMYLKYLVGNFEGMYQHYFATLAYLAPYFRQAAVGILYSLGLAWAAFCFLKAPVDRLQAGLGVLAMVFLSGYLISPTTNTNHLGRASGTELSVGGYYSFALAGSITRHFDNVVSAAWKASMVEAGGAGGGGPNREALTIAYNDKATEFADTFLKGEGKEAVKDFHHICGSAAITSATTQKELNALRSIGIGANTLGMDPQEPLTIAEYLDASDNKNGFGAWWDSFATEHLGQTSVHNSTTNEIRHLERRRTEALEFIKKLPAANNKIDGTKGYRIPTPEHYRTTFSSKDASADTSNNAFKTISGSPTEFQTMLPNGAVKITPNSEDDYIFYPQNCYDLYLVASETMRSLRIGAQGVKGFEKLNVAGAYTAATAANRVRQGINNMINKDMNDLGMDEHVTESNIEALTDTFMGATGSLGNEYSKWMLEYKIPTVISSMAMIVALLIITFPIFAIIAVIFGHKPLVSYLKLMAFPFLVVFINNLLLLLSANLITYSKLYERQSDTFALGGVDVPAELIRMNSEAIIYSVITLCEIAIVKFILWDDVRAVTSFNPGSASTAAVARGASMVGTAISLVGGVFGRATKMAAATKSAEATRSLNQTIAGISQQVTNIANSGHRSQNRSSGLGGGSIGGGLGRSGGSGITPGGGKGGKGGNTSLNPPTKPTA